MAVELGGPAALFGVVVLGGFWLTSPATTFDATLRLRYQGPLANEQAYQLALPHTGLLVTIGANTVQVPLTTVGEAFVKNIPGRFRDGTVQCDIAPGGTIVLVGYAASEAHRLPGPDKPLELRAALREDPERTAQREGLILVLQAAQETLMRTSDVLLPRIDAYLSRPSEAAWSAVIKERDRTADAVQSGIDRAIKYESNYGGLLGKPTTIASAINSARSDGLPGPITGGLIKKWNGRFNELVEAPPSVDVQAVAAWRSRLVDANQKVHSELVAMVGRLSWPR